MYYFIIYDILSLVIKMKKNSTERIIYFDYLRIVSIFFVIMIHVVGTNWFTIHINLVNWKILNIYNSISRFSVPIFVMISGALFLNKEKEIDIKKLYSKNILRLVTALLFWSLAYSVYKNIIIEKTINLFTLKSIFIGFINSHYTLWFIIMLIGLYMSIPICKKICEDKKTEEYFLILSLVFAFVLPAINQAPIINKYLTTGIFSITVPIALGYSGYFILGHYLNTYTISKRNNKIIYILGIISLIFTIIATDIFSNYKGYASEAFYNYLMINTLFVAIAIFVLFKNNIPKLKTSNMFDSIIIKISKLSFGIYLIHDFFVSFFSMLNLESSFLISISSPIIAIVIFILSLICSYIISKIPILNKYII